MARVLVIDDESEVRAGVARYLRFAGHEVREAPNGAVGLALASTEPPDLVITDINMPEMDGIEVILALSEKLPTVPVIAMSGGGRIAKEVLLASAGALGAQQVLGKPFELEDLRAAVARALEPAAPPG